MEGEDPDLDARQKKEKKELQAKITEMKHTVNKNDKKRKKEVMAEIARMEAELNQKHDKERQEWVPETKTENSDEEAEDEAKEEMQEKRATKARKRRDKKEAADKERNRLIEEEEKSSRSGTRQVERRALDDKLQEKGLRVSEIPADGNCLYNAIAHQLSLLGIDTEFKKLRQNTADCIASHREDFLPFLVQEATGEPLDDEQFEAYCRKVAKPTVWGGQPEIRALAMHLKSPIEVVQANGPSMTIGEEFAENGNKALVITFHRHAYRLGEHYNSTEPNEDDDEGFQTVKS